MSDIERLSHHVTISVSRIKDKIQENLVLRFTLDFFGVFNGIICFLLKRSLPTTQFLNEASDGDLSTGPLDA